MYTNAMVMGWMLDQYCTIHRAFTPAVVTGKPIPLGGSHGRETATADGAFFVLSTLLPKLAEQGEAKAKEDAPSVAIQGFGNAGAELATLLADDGYRIVGVADSRSSVYDPDGLDVARLREVKAETGSLPEDAGEPVDPDDFVELDVDVLVPAALEDVITPDNAERIKAQVVLEVANGPTAAAADAILAENGVTVIPDILANAGGVTVSYFEWAQNKGGVRWPADDVRARLEQRMVTESESIWALAQDRDVTLRTAAYAQGLERISAAVDAMGAAEHYQRAR
jgi:glutamate dehydrogenase (NADP+)